MAYNPGSCVSFLWCLPFQSTKLSLYEKRVVDMVLETKHLPEQLAATGLVRLGWGWGWATPRHCGSPQAAWILERSGCIKFLSISKMA